MSLIAELKRRNVFKVGIAYLVAAWLLLQLTEVLTELLEIGPDVGKIVIVLLLVGFIPALIFAWAFEMTPEGIKRDNEVDRTESIAPKTGRKLDVAIIGMLVAIAGYFIWESRFMDRAGQVPEPGASAIVDGSGATQGSASSQSVATNPASDQATAPNSTSIAVLPFANRSMQQEDAFFSDGIHDDLLTQLAKINDLKVVSRTSMMKYRDTDKSIPEIAAELQVGTILEGGVQRAGKRIRINAQLINVSTDEHLWAETFDREMTVENIFDIQTEITRQIVQAVRGELTEEEQVNIGRAPTDNLAAYEAYLQALSQTNQGDYAISNYTRAEEWINKALALDPEFALAWAELVEIHGQAVWVGYDTSAGRFDKAAQALENAKRFGGDSPEILAAEAEYAYRIEEDFPKARDLFQIVHRALPGDPDVMHKLGVAQRRTPDIKGALESFQLALEIDPSYSRSTNATLETLIFTGQFERVNALAERWRRRFPEVQDLRTYQIYAYFGLGAPESARKLMGSITPTDSFAYAFMSSDFGFLSRDLAEAERLIMSREFAALSTYRGFIGFQQLLLGRVYALKGETEKARESLTAAINLMTNLAPTGTYVDGLETMKLALAYAAIGEAEMAIEKADEAVRILPIEKDLLNGSELQQLRAHVLALAGERDEALGEIERLLSAPYRLSKWNLYQDMRWDFFRDDERFNDLIRPDGVSPEQDRARREREGL